jgi:hypothetical protein
MISRIVAVWLALAVVLGACQSMGPFFPADPTPFPPDFDRADCCRP